MVSCLTAKKLGAKYTIARIRGTQQGDLTVYHAQTPTARMALTWGGLLMTFWSAEAAQGADEAFDGEAAVNAAEITRAIQALRHALHDKDEKDENGQA